VCRHALFHRVPTRGTAYPERLQFADLLQPGDGFAGGSRGRGRLDDRGASQDADAGVLFAERGGGGLEDDLLGDTPDAREYGKAAGRQAIGAAGAPDGAREAAAQATQQFVGGCGAMLQFVGGQTVELIDRQQVRSARSLASERA
jgi:hypothetical protein